MNVKQIADRFRHRATATVNVCLFAIVYLNCLEVHNAQAKEDSHSLAGRTGSISSSIVITKPVETIGMIIETARLLRDAPDPILETTVSNVEQITHAELTCDPINIRSFDGKDRFSRILHSLKCRKYKNPVQNQTYSINAYSNGEDYGSRGILVQANFSLVSRGLGPPIGLTSKIGLSASWAGPCVKEENIRRFLHTSDHRTFGQPTSAPSQRGHSSSWSSIEWQLTDGSRDTAFIMLTESSGESEKLGCLVLATVVHELSEAGNSLKNRD